MRGDAWLATDKPRDDQRYERRELSGHSFRQVWPGDSGTRSQPRQLTDMSVEQPKSTAQAMLALGIKLQPLIPSTATKEAK